MSAEHEHKDNSGVLFWNSQKWIAAGGDRERPKLSGECTVNGKRLRVAAWEKQGANGLEFLSLAFSEPKESAKKFLKTYKAPHERLPSPAPSPAPAPARRQESSPAPAREDA
jgi:hypothetical protein